MACVAHGVDRRARPRWSIAPARPLLIAHVHLAIRPDRNPRKLPKRLGQGAVLVPWLIEQAAMIERVRRRAKRRRNLRARPIQASGGSCVIRCRVLSSASGETGRRAHQDHSSHAVNLRLAVDHFKRALSVVSALIKPNPRSFTSNRYIAFDRKRQPLITLGPP
jgi:hypothetical protein